MYDDRRLQLIDDLNFCTNRFMQVESVPELHEKNAPAIVHTPIDLPENDHYLDNNKQQGVPALEVHNAPKV
jgi:hypothetical protein